MDGEQQTSSYETNTLSPVHSSSSTPPANGRHPDARFSAFPGSLSLQPVSNLVECSAQDLKIPADQGDAVAQYNYGNCLQHGEGVRIDFQGAVHYFKLAADQRFAVAQYNYGNCLKEGEGVGIDFQGAADSCIGCSAQR
jgi:TPR repeat protein